LILQQVHIDTSPFKNDTLVSLVNLYDEAITQKRLPNLIDGAIAMISNPMAENYIWIVTKTPALEVARDIDTLALDKLVDTNLLDWGDRFTTQNTASTGLDAL
jgi:hypothetical protein